jgi:hypothetical protein
MLQYVCTTHARARAQARAQTQTQTHTDSKAGFRFQGLEQMKTRVRAPGAQIHYYEHISNTLATHTTEYLS